jgi:hypothetical protein
MQILTNLLMGFQFSALQVFIAGSLFFVTGYWLGKLKVKKMRKEINELQNQVLELNAELLLVERGTPVIPIKTSLDKKKNMTK